MSDFNSNIVQGAGKQLRPMHVTRLNLQVQKQAEDT